MPDDIYTETLLAILMTALVVLWLLWMAKGAP